MKQIYLRPVIKVKSINSGSQILASSGITINDSTGSFTTNDNGEKFINAKPYDGWNDNSPQSSGIVWDDEE